MSSFGSITLAPRTKDIRLEGGSKDALNSMLFFSLLVVVIFSFSFDPLAEESRRIAGGLIWVAFLFAAVVALNQTWARELRNQVLDAYRVLSIAGAGPGMAIDPHRRAGDLGAGGERDIFRRHFAAHPQPGNHAAAAAVSHLHSGDSGHGQRDRCHSHR